MKETDLCHKLIRDYINAEKEGQFRAFRDIIKCEKDRQYVCEEDFYEPGTDYRIDYYEVGSGERKKIISEYNVKDTAQVLIPGKLYEYEMFSQGKIVQKGSFLTKNAPPRYITMAKVRNFRDLGGWKVKSGEKIKYGLLYRSAYLNYAQSGDNEILRDVLKIKSELDLRYYTTIEGIQRADDGGQAASTIDGANYYKCEFYAYAPFCGAKTSDVYMERLKNSLVKIFAILGNEENYPLVFHCSQGADRTGILAYLICALLGADRNDLIRDYELTSACTESGIRARNLYSEEGFYEEISYYEGCNFDYRLFGFVEKYISEHYPDKDFSVSVEKFLTDSGVKRENISKMRHFLLE